MEFSPHSKTQFRRLVPVTPGLNAVSVVVWTCWYGMAVVWKCSCCVWRIWITLKLELAFIERFSFKLWKHFMRVFAICFILARLSIRLFGSAGRARGREVNGSLFFPRNPPLRSLKAIRTVDRQRSPRMRCIFAELNILVTIASWQLLAGGGLQTKVAPSETPFFLFMAVLWLVRLDPKSDGTGLMN